VSKEGMPCAKETTSGICEARSSICFIGESLIFSVLKNDMFVAIYEL